LVEYFRSEPFALEGITRFESWPLLVEGHWDASPQRISASGPGEVMAAEPVWAGIEREGSRQLHSLCALLSLSSGEPWQVRTSPKPLDILPAELPESWDAPPLWGQENHFLDPHEEGLPNWISEAWDQIGRDPRLASALTAWHQGLLLTPTHPSFAHVAFVGAIESLSHSATFEPIVRPDVQDPCPACGAPGDSSSRFWAMARQVATDAEVTELKNLKVLGQRGSTAHGAGFHGIETTYGSVVLLDWIAPSGAGATPTFRLDPEDGEQVFVLKVVPAVRRVGRLLLLHALGAGGGSVTSDL
jgi:hypothetical protein